MAKELAKEINDPEITEEVCKEIITSLYNQTDLEDNSDHTKNNKIEKAKLIDLIRNNKGGSKILKPTS